MKRAVKVLGFIHLGLLPTQLISIRVIKATRIHRAHPSRQLWEIRKNASAFDVNARKRHNRGIFTEVGSIHSVWFFTALSRYIEPYSRLKWVCNQFGGPGNILGFEGAFYRPRLLIAPPQIKSTVSGVKITTPAESMCTFIIFAYGGGGLGNEPSVAQASSQMDNPTDEDFPIVKCPIKSAVSVVRIKTLASCTRNLRTR